jgi:hypothetical protein
MSSIRWLSFSRPAATAIARPVVSVGIRIESP